MVVLLAAQIVVGQREVPILTCPEVHRVTTLLHDDVLGIVYPVQFHIALGLPCTGYAQNSRLRGIETCHVREGGSCLFKLALLELRFSQQQPGAPDKWVVLSAREPFYVLLRLPSAFVPLGSCLDAVLLDSLLRLLYGARKIALAQVATLFVAYGIERNQFRVVVLVAVLLLNGTVNKGLLTIEVGVVTGVERMPPSGLWRILLGRARSS